VIIKTRICQHCGQQYQPNSNSQKYCAECGPTMKVEIFEICRTRWGKDNPERMKALQTKWNKAHPEKARTRLTKWQKANPEKCYLHTARHRALKYDNTPINEILTETQWKTLLAKYDGHCAYCGKEAKLTLDHVIPLIQGGKHSIDNVVPACLHCNSSKGARTPEQWRRDLRSGNWRRPLELVREQSLVLEGD